MHCLSHHIYPNTLLDFEIQALEPVAYYLEIQPKNTILFGIIKEVLFPFATLTNILFKVLILPIIKKRSPEFFYLTSLIQIPLIYLMTNDICTALKLYVVMHIAISAYFVKMTFVGHRNGKTWTEGNE